MKIIDGKKIAEDIRADLIRRGAPEKFLAAIIAGEDPASLKFIERKKKFADSIGVEFKVFRVSDNDTEAKEVIDYLDRDEECGGIMIQLPLPSGMDKEGLIGAISKVKDIDALGNDASALSPAVLSVKEILKREGKGSDISVAVFGAGHLVGGPVARSLREEGMAVSVIDKGDDISPAKDADVVVLGAGQKGIVSFRDLKNDAIVIDFGCSLDDDGKICGDLDIEGIGDTDIAYTPTPGGTGPVLIAKLFDNFYKMNGK